MDIVSNRQRIARWLQTLIEELGEEYTPKLAVRHVTVNDRQVDIATFAPQKLGDDEGVFGDLVRRVGEAIDTDAEGLGGSQRYLVVAHAEDHVVARLPIRCSDLGGDGSDGEPIESEPPTHKGQVAQQMRHNEAMMRLFVVGMGQVVSTMQRTIVRLQQNADVSDERRLEAVEATEEYLSHSHERQLEVDKQKAETAVNMRGVGVFQDAIAAALGMWAARGGGHFIKLFQSLVGTLTPAQWEKLGILLSPEQAAIFEKMAQARNVNVEAGDGKAAGASAGGGTAAGATSGGASPTEGKQP